MVWRVQSQIWRLLPKIRARVGIISFLFFDEVGTISLEHSCLKRTGVNWGGGKAGDGFSWLQWKCFLFQLEFIWLVEVELLSGNQKDRLHLIEGAFVPVSISIKNRKVLILLKFNSYSSPVFKFYSNFDSTHKSNTSREYNHFDFHSNPFSILILISIPVTNQINPYFPIFHTCFCLS